MLKIIRKTPSRQNSPQGLPLGCKMRFSKCDHFIYQSIYMQIRYAHFMFFLKNVRTICSKSTENTCRGKTALIDNCASTTSLTQFSTSESYFFAFAVSEAVLYTSTLNQFFFSFLHLQWSEGKGEAPSHPNLLRSARSWSRFRAWHQLLHYKIERHKCCNGTFKVGGELSIDLSFFLKSQWCAPLADAAEPIRS